MTAPSAILETAIMKGWLLQLGSMRAGYSGMSIGLELSLSLAEYHKLMSLVGHPAVRTYWDATGTDHMGHPGDGTKGLEVLGSSSSLTLAITYRFHRRGLDFDNPAEGHL